MSVPTPRDPRAFAVLRQFVRPRADVQRCELCSHELAPEHPHLLERAARRIVCSCVPCSVLFAEQQGARFRRIPRDAGLLPDFRLGDEHWDALGVPIGLAFFVQDSHAGKVACYYPSPAGATETLLGLDAWPVLVEQNPVLATLEPDVEALLVNRVGSKRDHYRAPIDQCFKLVGLVRGHWRGLSGGAEVWQEVDRFFSALAGHFSGGHGHA